MGEAMLESGVFAHAKARALLEVVRLAFEGGIGFETESLGSNPATAQGNSEDHTANNGSSRPKIKHAKEYAQHPAHGPHRPASTGSSSRLVPGGPCMWCGVTATPQWRRPRGTNKLLCNACGIFFTRYGRLPERTHHVHAAVGQAAATETTAGESVITSAGATGNVPRPAAQGDVSPSPVEPADRLSANAAGADHPRGPLAVPGQPQEHHHQQQQQQQQPLVASPPALPTWHEEQQQHTGSAFSLLEGKGPHKRKAPPQSEPELRLRCIEEHCPKGANPLSTDVESAASPAPPPVPKSRPSAPTQQPRQLFGLAQQQPQLTSAAVAADQSPSSSLTVAPLDLNLQRISEMQQLGLLRPSLAGLGAPPSVRYLQDPVVAAAAGGSTGTASGSSAAATLAAAAACALRWLQSPELMGPATILPAILPGELLVSPYVLPLVRMPGGADAAAQPPQPPLYGRPAKRHERLPVGESEDSNVSTDSHTAGQCDAGGTSHDEDEGGTTTTGPTITTTTTTANTANAGTASSSVVVKLPSGLACSPHAMPGGTQSRLPSNPIYALAAAAAVLPTLADAVPEPSDDGQLRHQLVQLQQQLQQQQEVIFLHACKSKGPRSRAASATPSSSTLS